MTHTMENNWKPKSNFSFKQHKKTRNPNKLCKSYQKKRTYNFKTQNIQEINILKEASLLKGLGDKFVQLQLQQLKKSKQKTFISQ